jgi:L-seryl-tRNA(Ser) seleniumtransferase
VTDDPRRQIPSLHRLLDLPDVEEWSASWGRTRVTEAMRCAVSECRNRRETANEKAILGRALQLLTDADRPGLHRVINGSGVVLHTNLGRAPLSQDAIRSIANVAAGYCNLEYDIETGARGDRYDHCRGLLCELTGSQDAIVVNNNAAAVVLCVNEFALGRDVLVSRGELVEIGGSFRIPEMIERAGARLVEVGTTNRTRIDDYRRAISDSTALILKVHPANYRIEGFTSSVDLNDLVDLGGEFDVPVAWDLGSAAPIAVLPERIQGPLPAVGAGARADLVMWSGDKLLGGPQAGIIHGLDVALARLRKNPLLRTYRVDKLTLAALEATLHAWRDPKIAVDRVPIVHMLAMSVEVVRDRAIDALGHLSSEARQRVNVESMDSLVGGGSAPGETISSAGWVIEGSAASLDTACRTDHCHLIGRVSEGRFCLDFRCIGDDEIPEVVRIVEEALADQ